jgi:hypothetical protein
MRRTSHRQYWSQQGILPLSEIVLVEETRDGLADVVITTRTGQTVGCLVGGEDREVLCAAIRDAQRHATRGPAA